MSEHELSASDAATTDAFSLLCYATRERTREEHLGDPESLLDRWIYKTAGTVVIGDDIRGEP